MRLPLGPDHDKYSDHTIRGKGSRRPHLPTEKSHVLRCELVLRYFPTSILAACFGGVCRICEAAWISIAQSLFYVAVGQVRLPRVASRSHFSNLNQEDETPACGHHAGITLSCLQQHPGSAACRRYDPALQQFRSPKILLSLASCFSSHDALLAATRALPPTSIPELRASNDLGLVIPPRLSEARLCYVVWVLIYASREGPAKSVWS